MGVGGDASIDKMGGFRKAMPFTFVMFLIGALALAAFPLTSGFFSKDAILASALAEGPYGRVLFVVGLVGAFLTGLYTFRMVFLVFGGELSAYAREHLHRPDRSEPWLWMGGTVGVLAVLAVIGGWIQIPGLWHPLADFLEPAVEPLFEPSGAQDAFASVLAVTLGVAGIALAWLFYGARARPVPQVRPLQTTLERKFYFDEIYDWAFYKPAVWIARGARRLVEEPLIAGSLTGVAFGARRAGGEVAETQSGLVRAYAILLAMSVATLALVFVWVR
jgi:NADH-quinone oxidoreductase subunit L